MNLYEIQHELNHRRCLILGDIMLDKYLYGDVNRVSPEAPVPVVNIKKELCVLGGAGNVARNICAIGMQTVLCGVIGEDEAGQRVQNELTLCGIDFLGTVCKKRPTTLKTRIVGKGQQIVRFDEEETGIIPQEESEILRNNILSVLNSVDVVVISDYKKGVCKPELTQEIIKKAQKAGKLVIVDPKECDWTKYTGADYITPNLKEYGEALSFVADDLQVKNDHASIIETAKLLIDRYHLQNILVTRSEAGMTLAGRDCSFEFPTTAKSAFDVSGAGDTVLAVLAAFLCIGTQKKEAVELANLAAGISVSHLGTYAVSFEELCTAYEMKCKSLAPKVMEIDALEEAIRSWRLANKKVVFTNGCFDILHAGHVSYLRQAREKGDILIVGLNSDKSVSRIKGKGRPINSQDDRAMILAALADVDAVVIFDEDTPYKLIQAVKPDVLVKGGDYLPEQIVGREFAGVTITIPMLDGRSTTGILQKLSVCKEQNEIDKLTKER